ncbi:hypothetical protein [Bacteriovorax sp. Seq25_V]|uniref:hypothetical protein n=1 Tax=Bacteriovorax sp. Seq25_V TaxID=1201288 RepID=UPI00054E4DDD|nr:hypothetical protein [Bacteriovorax sp. Seq25_V]
MSSFVGIEIYYENSDYRKKIRKILSPPELRNGIDQDIVLPTVPLNPSTNKDWIRKLKETHIRSLLSQKFEKVPKA